MASLLRMQEKAKEFTVSRLATRDELPQLRTAPLLRYSDLSNGYRDASVWVWELDGYPVALAKVLRKLVFPSAAETECGKRSS